MVLCLAAALDVPLRQQNALLLAAGFAPVWYERDLAAPELAVGASAGDQQSELVPRMGALGRQEPDGAVASTVVAALSGAGRRQARG